MSKKARQRKRMKDASNPVPNTVSSSYAAGTAQARWWAVWGRVFGWLVAAAVFVLAALLCFRQIGEMDLGFHLRAGEWILHHRTWPQIDPFTYTVSNHPYIDLHWLYQVALVGLYRLGGSLALVVAHTALILATLALLCLIIWPKLRSPFGLAILLFIGVLAAELRFMIRPEIVSWVLLVLVLLILERRAAGKPTLLWLLPLIHLVWVNTQGLFVLGWVAIACYFFGEWIEQRKPDRSLAIWGVASIAAGLVNPYLLRGFLFPLTLLTRLNKENPFGQTISEFTSPWKLGLSAAQPFYPQLALWSYYVLAVLGIVGLLLTWRKRRLREVLLFFAFLALSAQAIRNMPLFVLAALPIMAAIITDLLAYLHQTGSPRAGRQAGRQGFLWERFPYGELVGAVLLLLLVAGLGVRVVTNAYYIDDRRSERFGYAFSSTILPVNAVSFLQEHGYSGRVLNHLNYGGYLMWQLKQPVFIDGRLEVMGEEFYHKYLAGSEKKQLLSLLNSYRANVVIFPYLVANSWLQQLKSAPQWQLAYFDHLSAIYVRKGTNPVVTAVDWPTSTPRGLPIPLPAEQRTAILNMDRVKGMHRWLEGFTQQQRFPQEITNLGIFYYYMDILEAAEATLLDAVQASQGRYYEIYNNLGAVYFKKQRYMEAALCYQTVLEDDLANELARQRLLEIQSRKP
jgi:tetratricopeptide (TPR) repeat protein